MSSVPSPAEGARARARRELLREITDAARAQLAEVGAAALSVRAVTRELGMAPSAVYRYFPNRDALLTALITEAYTGLADAAERAERGADRADLLGRWLAVHRGVRGWALGHPHEYGLIYGSPVPGYAAPQDTTAPASRVPLLLAAVAVDAWIAGHRAPGADRVPDALRADAGALLALALAGRPSDQVPAARVGGPAAAARRGGRVDGAVRLRELRAVRPLPRRPARPGRAPRRGRPAHRDRPRPPGGAAGSLNRAGVRARPAGAGAPAPVLR
ncbi:TetR/AcrR family transcriptional regulator [Cellulomonas sp. Y8]|uniref:TetR/AcrR family transcriptional regulator n=1 Tax=Cellulomonas sp. Y8 TaxID=2591145 RepID=UPI0011CCC0D8|nr:TetR/AcrR family transcriptional regulator [Cellulomonas sp. Y8]